MSAVAAPGTSARCDFELTNNGSFPVSVSAVTVDGAAFSLFSTTPQLPTRIEPGSKLTVRLTGVAPAAGTLAQGVASIVGARTSRMPLLYDAFASFPQMALRSDGCNDLGDVDRAFFHDCNFFLVNTGDVDVTVDSRSIDDTSVFAFRGGITLPVVIQPGRALFFGVRAGSAATGEFTTTMRWNTTAGAVTASHVGFFSDPAVTVVGVADSAGVITVNLRNTGAPTFIDRAQVVSGTNPGLTFLNDLPFHLGKQETRALRFSTSQGSFTTTVALGNNAREEVRFTATR